MKRFASFLTSSQKTYRDNVFKANGTDFGFNKNHGEWISKGRKSVDEMRKI